MSDSPQSTSDIARGQARARAIQMRLTTARMVAIGAVVAAIIGLVLTIRGLMNQNVNWSLYGASLVALILLLHCRPGMGLKRRRDELVVDKRGDDWTVGRYSELAVRAIARDVLSRLPRRWPRFRIFISSERETNAATWFEALWPPATGWRRVDITRGALHYLTPAELTAVLLHEAGHHQPRCRATPRGTTIVIDLLVHAAAMWIYTMPKGTVVTALLTFFGLRFSAQGLRYVFERRYAHDVEHACDLFAAAKGGAVPMINCFLKMGEDDELSGAILARAAAELLHDRRVELEDMPYALEESRPYGRMFHDNLFRHANEVIAKLREHGAAGEETAPRSAPKNDEIAEFLAERRRSRRPRLRWRTFDGDGDGQLDADEIARLCRTLREKPDHDLFVGETAWGSLTHPPHRARILLIHDCELAERGT